MGSTASKSLKAPAEDSVYNKSQKSKPKQSQHPSKHRDMTHNPDVLLDVFRDEELPKLCSGYIRLKSVTFADLQDLVKNATDPEKASVREAEGYLIVPDTVLTSLVSYSQNPDSIYAHRSVLAQMILKLTKEDK